MKLLLDTHIFLWFITGVRQLPDALRADICDQENDVFLSVVSLWEVSIKHGLGKLPLPEPPGAYLPRQRERHGIATLEVDEASVARLDTLPLLHRDPFDRMLICQAIEHGLLLATLDDAIRGYTAAPLWRSR